ncbi:MAG: tetratricopeptide repeat protein, partial [Byssovorax cruenta]
ALEVVLEDCLKSAVVEHPHLIVLEDVHWIDPLSRDLLETLARLIEHLPVCFVLAYRPSDQTGSQTQRIESLPYFTKIEFKDLTSAEAELLIRAKLAQLFPERMGTLPQALADELTLKSQGNPFFIEELLNYLHDRGLNPYDSHALSELQLPASLQTLILSRIDQFTEPLRVTLKVASIIGRVFPFSWLHGYYPSLGSENVVKDHLAELSQLDLTPLDTPDPELAYLFKHIVTQEVAYESISYTTRAQLHELLARYLEEMYPGDLYLDALAFHYSRSNNLSKKREYLRKSGDAAKAAYANTSALDYYRQALEAAPDPHEALDLHISVGTIHQLIGNRNEARGHFQQALQIATVNGWMQKIIECEIKLGMTWTIQADYPQALEWLQRAHAHATQANYLEGLCDVFAEIGIVHWRLKNFEQAGEHLQQSINLARKAGDKKREAYALSMLGQIKAETGKFAEARDIFEASLALAREIKDMRRIAGIDNNYALTNYYQGDYETAQRLLEESLQIVQEVGDKRGVALSLNNLGNIYYLKNDFESARKYYERALEVGHEIDDKYVGSLALSGLGITLFRQGRFVEARPFYQQSLALNQEIGDKLGLSLLHCYLGLLALAQNRLADARTAFMKGLMVAHQSDIRMYAIYNLIGMAKLFLIEGKPSEAIALLAAATQIFESAGLRIEPELQEPYDEVLTQTRKGCSEDAFQTAWETGKNMDLEHAVKFATDH